MSQNPQHQLRYKYHHRSSASFKLDHMMLLPFLWHKQSCLVVWPLKLSGEGNMSTFFSFITSLILIVIFLMSLGPFILVLKRTKIIIFLFNNGLFVLECWLGFFPWNLWAAAECCSDQRYWCIIPKLFAACYSSNKASYIRITN